jgi:hypothetical protein
VDEKEWTRQAIGEHASIASFCSFTLQLLTNRAPPHLVEASLRAALDELNHATAAFEIASQRASNRFGSSGEGVRIEPGALPPTSLRFEQNLTALGVATAREGCIDETLSALLMAAEVVVEGRRSSSIADKVDGLQILQTKRQIAWEEGSHAALAWKTILWICQTDGEACGKIRSEVLNRDSIPRQHVATEEKQIEMLLQPAWVKLFETLLEFAFSNEDVDENETNRVCSLEVYRMDAATAASDDSFVAADDDDDDDRMSFLEALVGSILRQVMCAH